MSFTFIGDVHGWYDRLLQVLGKSRGLPVFVGDLIDRGPTSAQVLEEVYDLCMHGEAQCVIGNHEFALVRALGIPELGIPGDPVLFQEWQVIYGGLETLESYGLGLDDADALRSALGDKLPWMASLPWHLDLRDERYRYLVMHSGLLPEPLQPQLDDLSRSARWWQPQAPLPPFLFERRIYGVPDDLPLDTWVVSGHTPLPAAICTTGRILCDSSGGRQDRPLSAVVMPDRAIITGMGTARYRRGG